MTSEANRPSIAVKVFPEGGEDFENKYLLEDTMQPFGFLTRMSGTVGSGVEVYGYTTEFVEQDRVRAAVEAAFPGALVQIGTVQKTEDGRSFPVYEQIKNINGLLAERSELQSRIEEILDQKDRLFSGIVTRGIMSSEENSALIQLTRDYIEVSEHWLTILGQMMNNLDVWNQSLLSREIALIERGLLAERETLKVLLDDPSPEAIESVGLANEKVRAVLAVFESSFEEVEGEERGSE